MNCCRSKGCASILMLRATLLVWTVVNLRADAREVEHESENSILSLLHNELAKPNLKPDSMHLHKYSLSSPTVFQHERREEEKIGVSKEEFFRQSRAFLKNDATAVSKIPPKARATIIHPKTKSFVKITFSSPQLIRRSMRKRLKKLKASALAKSKLKRKEFEALNTNHIHTEGPQSESPGSFSDRLRQELVSLFDRVEHSSVGLLQTVLRQQLPLEDYNGNSIEDFVLGSKPTSQLYQPEVGGSCFSSLGEPGMCVPLEDCPQLRPLVHQLHVKNAVLLLVQQLCRLGGTKYFVCCEYPAFQNPPHAVGTHNAMLPKFQKSVYSAALPGEGECGMVGPQPEDGDGQHRQLEPNEWPWLVAVGRAQDREVFRVQCSGSLITRRHVLTAATCFYLQEVRQPTMVRVGEHDLGSRDGSSSQDYLIVGRNDPGWVLFFNQDNLMLLTLDRDVTLSAQVQPACLPPASLSVPEVGSAVVAAGWKRVRTASNDSNAEQELGPDLSRMEVVSLRECQTSYSNLETNFFLVDNRNICVVEDEDSPQCCAVVGAPVMRERSDGAYELVGVVTIPSIASQYLPTVGTRVSAYRRWLENVVGA